MIIICAVSGCASAVGMGICWAYASILARAEASDALADVLAWAEESVPDALAKLPTVAVLGDGASSGLAAALSSLGTVVVRGATGGQDGSPRILTGDQPTDGGLPDGVRLARRIADEIEARSGFSLVRRPQLGVVVFERDGWTRADYEAWSQRLLDVQHAFVTPSSHDGRPNARFAILNPRTTFDDLTGILDTMH